MAQQRDGGSNGEPGLSNQVTKGESCKQRDSSVYCKAVYVLGAKLWKAPGKTDCKR
ncbi:MAG: hypothetical protein CNCCGFBP_02401 [Fimbriimonadaceae bacterium]|nr:hypothetical protein [Fimbriimonadaceae bacterium]